MEKQLQMQTLTLVSYKRKVLKEGIQSCLQQILATPIGQQFLHVFHKDLEEDFCNSPAMMKPLAELFEKILEEGHQFLLKNMGSKMLMGLPSWERC